MPLIVRALLFLTILGVVTLGSGLGLRSIFPDAWRRWLRRVWIAAPAVAAVGIAIWMIGRGRHDDSLMRIGAPLTAVIMMTIAFVFFTSPLWGLLGVAAKRTPDPSRRAFLGKALGVVPATAALAGPAGAFASRAQPQLREVEVRSAHIPKALDGLTILQISDVHLGAFIDVDQVASVVAAARPRKPDLVALTGDIADDLKLLPAAMEHIASLAPPLGMFAIVGNHEIYRGRDAAIELFTAGGATFLCNDGVVVEHNGARLWLGGTDDPVRLDGQLKHFYRRSVERCLKGCPDDVTCKIVLAHRPSAFDATSLHDVALTLSGHTHGAQMALFGRSLLEGLIPMKYLLGLYRKDESVLFTTAGLGHWFPFRLNCPTEAALITLRSA